LFLFLFFSLKTGVPLKQIKISIADFDINEYHKIRAMIELVGGQGLNEVSPDTDIVVSQK